MPPKIWKTGLGKHLYDESVVAVIKDEEGRDACSIEGRLVLAIVTKEGNVFPLNVGDEISVHHDYPPALQTDIRKGYFKRYEIGPRKKLNS